MSVEEFNTLSDRQKKEIIVDAEKIAEREDDVAKYELFRIDNFFVEVSRSITYRFRKILNTYSVKDIPTHYAGDIRLNVRE